MPGHQQRRPTRRHRRRAKRTLAATDEETALARAYRCALLEAKAAEATKDRLHQELRVAIGDAAGISTPDGPVTFKTNAAGARPLTIPRSWHKGPPGSEG